MAINHGNFEDCDDNDRISRLPRDVIDVIVAFLPIRDAARTSVFSSNWRYVWTNQQSLVLDNKFWNETLPPRGGQVSGCHQTCIVTRMLLRHIGNVEKFVVDISDIGSQQHSDISLWISVLCGRGLKELSIKNSASNEYTIPSCVFYALELTRLSISNCIINKTKESFTFRILQKLALNGIDLNSFGFLSIPLLTSLTLEKCVGIRGFTISAPKLTSLYLKANDDLNLIPYLICTNIAFAYIWSSKNIVDHRDIESINLLNLLSSWPAITDLFLDGPSLKYLTTGIVPDSFSKVLKLLRFVPFKIDLDNIAWILHMIRNSPLLRTLEIWLNEVATSTNDLEALEYLEEQSIMNMSIQRLQKVRIRFFKGSKSELQLVKILLHCSMSLKLLFLEDNKKLTSDERLKISKELICLQHAYPKPKIIFGDYV